MSTPMDIDTFAGKLINSIPLPNKPGYYLFFDEFCLKWRYIQETPTQTIQSNYLLRSNIKTIT